jgi:hypothetical protein
MDTITQLEAAMVRVREGYNYSESFESLSNVQLADLLENSGAYALGAFEYSTVLEVLEGRMQDVLS